MKIGCVADVHVGNHRQFGGGVKAGINYRCRCVLWSLRRALRAASDAKCSHFVVAGDLMDTACSSPQMISAVAELFTAKYANGMEVHLLLGNHEVVSNTRGDHGLGPFQFIDNVHVWDTPHVENKHLVFIPYNINQVREHGVGGHIREVLRNVPRGDHNTLVVMHTGIRDDNTSWVMSGLANSVHVSELNVLSSERVRDGRLLFVSGDWHSHKEWREKFCDVVIPGALAPTGFGESGDATRYGGLVIFDTDKDKDWYRIVVPGPRFAQIEGISNFHLLLNEVDLLHNDYCDPLFVRVLVDPQHFNEAKELWAAYEKQEENAPSIELHLDIRTTRQSIEEQAVEAAAAARSAESFDEAIDLYLETLDVPDTIDREKVRTLVSTYRSATARTSS